ncbi:MAG: glucose-6-phosphate isomerase [Proteobacteria bacterium]|nr:glucose-6-phosphate isomerase [Pseudomonadota bacterium]
MSRLEVRLRRAGLSARELTRHAASLRAALARLDAGTGGEFLRVIHERRYLREISRCVASAPPGLTDVVQLGIGGSSLGAHALCRALLPPRRQGLRWHFPDNIDPESFGPLLERLDPRRTLVHVVSKSGGTLETLAQLHALLARWAGRSDLGKRFVVTTGDSGPLRDFAEEYAAPLLSAPADVAGRFSVFTASGLFVPALCGVPVGRVLAGAREMLVRCREDRALGPAGRLATLHHEHDRRGRSIHVELIYGDALLPLGEWFRQIWAESLGKGGRGPTPIVARGTTDQHSQIQLYVDGPDDKLYTLLRVGRSRSQVRVARGAQPSHIRGRSLGEIFRAQEQGTLQALRQRGRPLVELCLERVSASGIGELLLLQQLQTALAGELYGVNPFDQPGVEAGKRAAARILRASRRR